MAHTITLIPGDGIGPEITDATVRVLDATGVGFEWEKHEGGVRAFERTGNPLPEELLESIRRNGLALKGPLTTLVGEGFPSANVALRKGLDLYANLRPVRSVPGVKSRYENVSLVIVRENTEDLYSGIEHMIMPGVTQGLKVITFLRIHTNCPIRLRVCAPARATQGHRSSQSQHHEAHRRALLGERPTSG